MSSTIRLHSPKAAYILCGALLLGNAARVCADPKPLSKAEQAKVDKAVEKGIAYLKRSQKDNGDWPKPKIYWSGRYSAGLCLLPAYALLEAGVPANDPTIQKAANNVRPIILKSEETYELSLAVLFFSRLGDPKDRKLIRVLSLRLVAGQHHTGGWNYRCPTLREEDEDILIKLLEDLTKILNSDKPLSAESIHSLHVPRKLKTLTVFQDPKSIRWVEPRSSEFSRQVQLFAGTTDNSNTQFAMLGLWAVQRHGIPVAPTFRLLVERFMRTQRKDGWWPYDLRFSPRTTNSSSSMICVGLMGLAIGHGLKAEPSNAHLSKSQDGRVLAGLAALYQQIGSPTGQMEVLVPLKDIQYRMYFLWSVERVAMLFDLSTIGDKDWYRWGTEMLITNQNPGGDWEECGPVVGTSLALLFLKRSHPMKDLTPKLPFTAKELNDGIFRSRNSKSHLER